MVFIALTRFRTSPAAGKLVCYAQCHSPKTAYDFINSMSSDIKNEIITNNFVFNTLITLAKNDRNLPYWQSKSFYQ